MTNKNLWGGRFTHDPDEFVQQFTESVSYDCRLYEYDIIGSIAHVEMLAEVKIIDKQEAKQIISGLDSIREDIAAGHFQWSQALEDVHLNIEAELVRRIGEVGKKIHTGRSRNDQIATDMRLYLRAEIDNILALLVALIDVLLQLVHTHRGSIMPGFTHLQIAQPVTLGHHLMAWCEMLLRDRSRLQEIRQRTNILPLGSAALSGTSFPINRQQVADKLEFEEITQNSLDAVSDRDFMIEFCFAGSMIMMHLSRFSEEVILWNSPLMGFVELSDRWCTGSSIMPQKKNPDVAELVRGKTARVYGSLISLLTLMKAQPLAYNRDNQEDKEMAFNVVDTVKPCLQAYIGMLPEMKFNTSRMRQVAASGYSTATELADYLVRIGLPFRDAHRVVGEIVKYALQHDKSLDTLTLEELQRFHPNIDKNVYEGLTVEKAVASRVHVGGTAPEQVAEAVNRVKKQLNNT